MAADDARLRADADRVERLLDELRGLAGPAAWQRIEELVERLVGLYGAALERLVVHATDAGAEGLPERLAGDELVASLLAVHGLPVVPLAERIERALEEVRPLLGLHAGGVELAGIDPDGVVRLRLLGTCDGCPASAATLEHTLRRAVEAAAPEVTGVAVDVP